MNSNQKGNISQQAIILELMKFGIYVYTLSGEGAKVDFLFTFDFKKFYRCQAKSVSLISGREGTVYINTRGTTRKNQKIVYYTYEGIVDFIGAYDSNSDKCYLLPIDVAGKSGNMLRTSPTKNNQKKRVKWAKDYELKIIVEKLRP